MTKINRIYVKNIKAITEQEVNLAGCSAIITAGNNKGKSTLLNILPDRIRSQKPSMIIKDGEKSGSAEIELDSGDRFVWNVKQNKEELIHINNDGVCSTSVREMSKRFFPEKFDIDKFLSESPKKQAEMLQKLAGIDFTELDKQYKAAYENRTYINRKLKEQGEVTNPIADDSLPDEKIDIDTLQTEVNEAYQHNGKLKDTQDHLDSVLNEIDKLKIKIQQLEEESGELNGYLSKHDYIDIHQMNHDLREAIETNKKIDEIERNRARVSEYQKMQQEAVKADELVKSIEQQRKDMLAKANLPDGIAITDDGLQVDGLPLDRKQLSLSKIYTTALKLAALTLGEVKTLYFDASPLDKNSLLEIEKWARDNDLQLLIEKPDFDGGEIRTEIIKETN